VHRQKVVSSVLSSIGYDPVSMTLEIEFHSGAVYRYLEVPRTAYQQLLAAPSLGRHFNAEIRDRYRTEHRR
jgi:hypothetical protein